MVIFNSYVKLPEGNHGYEALKHFGFLELLGHDDHQEIKGGLARSEIFVCGRIHKCKVGRGGHQLDLPGPMDRFANEYHGREERWEMR